MSNFNPTIRKFNTPNPNDTKIEFGTYRNLVRSAQDAQAKIVGNLREFGREVTLARIDSITAGIGSEIEATEVRLNSSGAFVDDLNPKEWNGTTFPYLLNASQTYSPAVNDIVVVYEVRHTDDIATDWVFHAEAADSAELLSFRPIYNDDDTINFQNGYVFVSKEDKGTLVTDGTFKSDLGTDKKFYVEITSSYDSTIAVNASIQSTTDALWPDFYDIDNSGELLTIKWPLGEISSDVYIGRYEGDIHIPLPYVPKYTANIQGDTINKVQLLGVDDANTSSVGDDKDVFLTARQTTHQFVGGCLRDAEDAAQNLEFGGVTASASYTTITATFFEDLIEFTNQDIEINTDSGLVQVNDATEGSGFTLEAIKWVGLEDGSGTIFHRNSPVTSTGDSDHWECFDVLLAGGGSKEVCVDEKGHIWELGGSSQPTPPENFRYKHCSLPVSFADIILASAQATNYIEVDGECYELAGTTEDDTTSPTPTVTATYDDCVSCESSVGSREKFRRCDDVTTNDFVLQGSDVPDSDYIWSDQSGAFLKYKSLGSTSDAPTSPVPCIADPGSSEVPVTQRVTPTGCGDVDYGAFGDNFSGSSIQCFWDNVDGASENVQSGGTLTQTPTTSNVVIGLGQTKIPIGTDNYTFIKSKFTTTGFVRGVANPDDPLIGMLLTTTGGTTNIWINWNWNNASKTITPRIDGTFGTQVNTTATAGYYRFRKISGTVYCDFSTNGTTWTNYQSAASASSINEFRLTTKDDNPSPSLVGTWDWVEIEP